MPDLKTDHQYLYRRVCLKSGLMTLMGLSMLSFPGKTPSIANAPIAKYFFDIRALGVVFIILGVIVAVGLFRKKKNYLLARLALTFSAVYSATWAGCLLWVAYNTPSALPIALLWCYLTINLFIVSSDPGWGAIEYINRFKERKDV